MSAAISLKVFELDDGFCHPAGEREDVAGPLPALPTVERRRRHGPALQPTALGGPGEVLAVSLVAGAAPACPFCPTPLLPMAPTAGAIRLYADGARQVADELDRRGRRPRAVCVSPALDPFAPLVELQQETARVVAALAGRGVEVWLRTRGYVRPAALRVLAEHRDLVRLVVGLATLDRDTQRALEPLAAPPGLRLRQITRCRELGIPVQVALEPLVPGVTDTPASLGRLLGALAAAGVRHVTAGYLCLRPSAADRLRPVLQAHGWDGAVLAAFEGGPLLRPCAHPPARYLPKARRQRGYATLAALAADVGITVAVSRTANPDFRMSPRPRTAAGSFVGR